MLARIGWLLWWVGLAAYFGAMAFLPTVASSVFATVRRTEAGLPGTPEWLKATDQLGGEIFGDVLVRFSGLQFIFLGLMFVGLVFWFIAPATRTRRSTLIKALLVIVLTIVACYDALVLMPDVMQTRTQMRARQDAETKTRFDTLHQRSTRVGQVKLGVLLAAVVVSALSQTGAGYRRVGTGHDMSPMLKDRHAA